MECGSRISSNGFCGVTVLHNSWLFQESRNTRLRDYPILSDFDKETRDDFLKVLLGKLKVMEPVSGSIEPFDTVREKLQGCLQQNADEKCAPRTLWLSVADIRLCLEVLDITNVFVWEWVDDCKHYILPGLYLSPEEYR